MHKHCNNVRGIIIHPLKQIFPSPLCNHWQKVPLYITKVGCSVQMLNKVMFWASSFFFCRVDFKPGDVLECVGWRQLAEASHVLPGLPCPSPFNACRAANIYRASCERPECLLLKLVAPHWECVCIWAMKKRCFFRCSRCLSDEALPLVSPQSANTSTWLSFRPPALSSVCESTVRAKSWRGGRSSLWIFCKRQKDGRCVCGPRLILYTRLQHWHHVFAAGTFS